MAGYAELDIEQGADFGLQVIWTDLVNEGYRVVHPMRLQARAVSGQTVIDLTSVDQTVEQPQGSTPRIVYSTEGGVVQIIVPASITSQMPAGTLFYDLFVSYESTQYNHLTNEETVTTRTAKLIAGKINVEGRVTKHV